LQGFLAASAVSISPISDAMYGDGVFSFVEQHAVAADAQA
jgi:hypothetical protein